jgi:hypothetical protein
MYYVMFHSLTSLMGKIREKLNRVGAWRMPETSSCVEHPFPYMDKANIF